MIEKTTSREKTLEDYIYELGQKELTHDYEAETKRILAMFKDAINTNDYEYWDDLWGLNCFFNHDDAVDYYKKSVKDLVDALDKKIDNLEKQRSKYIEILNSFE